MVKKKKKEEEDIFEKKPVKQSIKDRLNELEVLDSIYGVKQKFEN
jgi:hypothetical protein